MQDLDVAAGRSSEGGGAPPQVAVLVQDGSCFRMHRQRRRDKVLQELLVNAGERTIGSLGVIVTVFDVGKLQVSTHQLLQGRD
jgi:hypothetical protein